MRKSILTLSVAAALSVPGLAAAQATTAAAPASPHTITGNMGLFSEYRFRGIAQTFETAAFQGGFDYAHASGFYAGNWNSNVAETLYAGASLEMDFYGGFKKAFGDFGIDVGAIYYYYPGSDSATLGKIDNTEVYIGGSWKWISLKYYHAVSDFFSAPDTKGSSYIDLTGTFDLGSGWGIVGHYGQQKIKNFSFGDYNDWKLGVTKDLGNGWNASLSYIDTDAEEGAYTFSNASQKAPKFLGDTTFVISVGKTF
jgi:uncharacterized protein (TIGR02001 family)